MSSADKSVGTGQPVATQAPNGRAGSGKSVAVAWWRNAVVYQVYVRSFSDSNGDGIGDIPGITSRLEYLQQLGVEALWLTPCYPSPQFDHGYDVADYFDIEPDYGTLADFDSLVANARERGIKILMDVVPNHCSSHHAWFVEALSSPVGSAARERFYFRDGRGPNGDEPPNNWLAVFGGPAWSRELRADGSGGQWYLQTFTPWQPDFNWSNPEIIDYFDRMLRFWFDRGVEGFRVDAVTVLGKEPGLPDAPPPPPDSAETDAWSRNPYTVFHPSAHDVWRHWRVVINDYEATHPGRELVTVSEAYTSERPELLAEYVGGDQFHQSFAFDLMLAPWIADSYRAVVADVIESLAAVNATPAWTMNNHDTQRIVTRLGRSNAADPNSFTGNNLVYVDAPVDVAVGTRRAKAAIATAAALPGTIYLYFGEELGLPEVLDLPAHARQDPIFSRTDGREIGRDGCRVPMSWAPTPADSFGFSTIDSGEAPAAWMPQPSDWGQYSVQTEAQDPQSMLWWYRTVFSNRRHLDGPFEWAECDQESLVAFNRGDVLIVLNIGPDAVTLPSTLVGTRQVVLSSSIDQHSPDRLPGDCCVWLR